MVRSTPRLNLDLLVVQVGECTLQVVLCPSRISAAILRDSQERLDSPKIGLHFEGGAQVRSRSGVIALKEKQYAEVCLAVEIPRVERNQFAEHWNGELGFLLLKELLYLLFQCGDFTRHVLGILRHQAHTGHQDDNCPTGP